MKIYIYIYIYIYTNVKAGDTISSITCILFFIRVGNPYTNNYVDTLNPRLLTTSIRKLNEVYFKNAEWRCTDILQGPIADLVLRNFLLVIHL